MPSRILNERAVGHLVDPDEAETINVLGPTVQFLTPPEGENAPCIMRGSIPPAGFVPMHSHADPETFMLLSGSVEGLVYEDERFRWV
jgi:quercetin dioxygenase-like cupin family protein